MDVLKLKYCNNNGFLIKNNRSKFKILKKINNILDYNVLSNNYKIYSDRLEYALKNRNTACTYLTTGKPCLLYLTKINGEPIALIIEKTINKNNIYPKIISVSLHFNDELYDDTLLTAELYRIDNNWFLIIDTLLIFKGKKTLYQNHNNIKMLTLIIQKYQYLVGDSCKVIVKKYMKPSEIGEFMKTTNFKLSGIKFINKSPIHFYFNKKFITFRNDRLFILPTSNEKFIQEKLKELTTKPKNKVISKVKNDVAKTFILKIKTTNNYGIYHLFATKKSELKNLGIARTNTLEISNQLLEKFRNVSEFNVEAEYDYDFNKFRVIKIVEKSTLSNYNNISKLI